MILSLATTFLFLILFLLISFVVLYLPGHLIIGSKKDTLTPEDDVFLSLALGIMILILLSVFWGIIRLRFLALPSLISICTISIFRGALKEGLKSFQAIFKNKLLIGLLFLGIIVQGLINFPSGFAYKDGVSFWSSQGHDGLWHVSLIKEMKDHFPLNNPLYANKPLQNYHYTSDLLMGEFYRLFSFFNPLDLYFRYFPVIFSFLIGLGVFSFTSRKWNTASAYWAVFFTYFCGSFGYIYSILHGGFLFTGETAFWAAQGNTVLGNPPHALGIILLTASVLSLLLWVQTRKTSWLLVLGILSISLTTIKISSGVIMLISLGIAGIYLFLKEKRFDLLITAFVLGITNFISLKAISPSAESFLMFLPLWFPRTMMVDKLSNVDWELRRQHYISKNTWHSWLRVIQLELEAILIFIVGNSGARVIGFLKIVKKVRQIDSIDVFLYSAIVFPVIFVLLFVQKGIIYNFIQFMQIYLHFLGILSGVTVAFILSKVRSAKIKVLISVIIIMFLVPTVIGNIFDFYGPKTSPNSIVSNSELTALKWLKDNSRPNDVILTKPFIGDPQYRYPNKPWPISAWYSTPYVYVFSDRYAYLTGEEQLLITGYRPEQELILLRKFFTQSDFVYNRSLLKEKNIAYIYVRQDEIDNPLDEKANGIVKVFSNNEVFIYRVNI